MGTLEPPSGIPVRSSGPAGNRIAHLVVSSVVWGLGGLAYVATGGVLAGLASGWGSRPVGVLLLIFLTPDFVGLFAWPVTGILVGLRDLAHLRVAAWIALLVFCAMGIRSSFRAGMEPNGYALAALLVHAIWVSLCVRRLIGGSAKR